MNRRHTMEEKQMLTRNSRKGLVPLRMRRQLTSPSCPTPERAAPPPAQPKQEDSVSDDDDGDCFIIDPDPSSSTPIEKKPRLFHDEEGASTSCSPYPSQGSSMLQHSEEKQDSDVANRSSVKTFQSSSQSLTARIKNSLLHLRRGKEQLTRGSPAPQMTKTSSDEDDVGSMSVADLMKKVKAVSAVAEENKDLRNKLANLERQFKSMQSRLNQKEVLVGQYETEIETMTELLKDAEKELDKIHQERMVRDQSEEEKSKLKNQLKMQKEMEETITKLQHSLSSSTNEVKSLNTKLTKVTKTSQQAKADLTAKTQEVAKMKETLEEAEESSRTMTEKMDKMAAVEKDLRSELLYKCSMLTLKTDKEEKDEKEMTSCHKQLKESEAIRRKSLDVASMCYSTIGAMAKELRRCKDISRSLSDLLQDLQLKLVERQVIQVSEDNKESKAGVDENLKEILEKIWQMQKKFLPVALIDIAEDDIGNIKSKVAEVPSPPPVLRGRGRGRRPRGWWNRGRGNSTSTITLPPAPAITNIPGDLTEFEKKMEANNQMLLRCLDLLGAAYSRTMPMEAGSLEKKEELTIDGDEVDGGKEEVVSDDEKIVTIISDSDDDGPTQQDDSPEVELVTPKTPHSVQDSPESRTKGVTRHISGFTIPLSVFNDVSKFETAVSALLGEVDGDFDKGGAGLGGLEGDGGETAGDGEVCRLLLDHEWKFSLADFDGVSDCSLEDKEKTLQFIDQIRQMKRGLSVGPQKGLFNAKHVSLAGKVLKMKKGLMVQNGEGNTVGGAGEGGVRDVEEGASMGDSDCSVGGGEGGCDDGGQGSVSELEAGGTEMCAESSALSGDDHTIEEPSAPRGSVSPTQDEAGKTKSDDMCNSEVSDEEHESRSPRHEFSDMADTSRDEFSDAADADQSNAVNNNDKNKGKLIAKSAQGASDEKHSSESDCDADIVNETLSIMKKMAEDAEHLFDFDDLNAPGGEDKNKKRKIDDDNEEESCHGNKKRKTEEAD